MTTQIDELCHEQESLREIVNNQTLEINRLETEITTPQLSSNDSQHELGKPLICLYI